MPEENKNPLKSDVEKAVSSSQNEFLRLFQETGGPLDEKLLAVYSRAMQDDCFSHYVFQPEPLEPMGFRADYENYKKAPLNKRAEHWREFSSKYSGYFRALEIVKAENDSNEHFLNEMLAAFEKAGIVNYVFRIKSRLVEFKMTGHIK